VPPPDGYLDKPVDERTLLRNVRKILSLSRRRGTAEERQAHEHES
jgi:hypothetical protein